MLYSFVTGEDSVSVSLQAEAPPLREDESGALRVGKSRVLLDLVIGSFEDGATPEAIVQQYSTLALGDVYAVIAYYLRHRDEVQAYMERREELARQVEHEIKSRQGDLSEIRARLDARRHLP
jgi:uncharacterized protein (DUF433 family)